MSCCRYVTFSDFKEGTLAFEASFFRDSYAYK